MIRSYIKIAWRNLWRNKVYSFINIFGLSLGLASAIIILLSLENEITFDKFHAKRDVLYQVWNRDVIDKGEIKCWPTTCSPLGPVIKETVPEVSQMARTTYAFSNLVSVKSKSFMALYCGTDPAFLIMFTLPLLKGNSNSALNEINSIVITESLAKKLFGNEDPMGQTIVVNTKEPYKVTGVMKDLPNNTKFKFEFLIPWSNIVKDGNDGPWWGNNAYQTYVELKNGASEAVVNNKIKNIIKANDKESTTEPFLHAIAKWHLYSSFENGKISGGRITYVYMIGIIAAFILLIACINFMNLSTARSEKRAREVGIRKVVGAGRRQLIMQFLGESVFITAIAFLFSIILVQFMLPGFNSLVGKQLQMDFSNALYWLAALLIILITGLLAGSYPAFYLSSFLPVTVLKSRASFSNNTITPRKVLVVLQFVFSIILIICTIIIENQIKFGQERPSGYNKANLVSHKFTGSLRKNYTALKNELINSGTASTVFTTTRPVTEDGSNTWGISWKGKNPKENIIFDKLDASDGFADPLQVPIVQGRDINIEKYPEDSTACLINESSVNVIGFKEPLGQILVEDSTDFHVVGVFKDFIWGSPFYPTRAMFVTTTEYSNVINIRLNSQNKTGDNLRNLERIFKKYNPDYPYELTFIDEDYALKFKTEEVIGKLASISAILAIIISCLGLFGLAAFTAEQRTKEIGVRRVLGASIVNVVVLLSKDFLKLVLLAALIAFPTAWWAMHAWLQNYYYRITISPWVFIAAGCAAIIIALITVSFQALKAATISPVKSLRSE